MPAPLAGLTVLDFTRVLSGPYCTMQLADMEFSRPLTHDLLVAVLGGLGGTLKKVVITRVEKNTYYAELLIHRNGEVISVDGGVGA